MVMEASLATRVMGFTVHQQLESMSLLRACKGLMLWAVLVLPMLLCFPVTGLSPALGPGMFSAGTEGTNHRDSQQS